MCPKKFCRRTPNQNGKENSNDKLDEEKRQQIESQKRRRRYPIFERDVTVKQTVSLKQKDSMNDPNDTKASLGKIYLGIKSLDEQNITNQINGKTPNSRLSKNSNCGSEDNKLELVNQNPKSRGKEKAFNLQEDNLKKNSVDIKNEQNRLKNTSYGIRDANRRNTFNLTSGLSFGKNINNVDNLNDCKALKNDNHNALKEATKGIRNLHSRGKTLIKSKANNEKASERNDFAKLFGVEVDDSHTPKIANKKNDSGDIDGPDYKMQHADKIGNDRYGSTLAEGSILDMVGKAENNQDDESPDNNSRMQRGRGSTMSNMMGQNQDTDNQGPAKKMSVQGNNPFALQAMASLSMRHKTPVTDEDKPEEAEENKKDKRKHSTNLDLTPFGMKKYEEKKEFKIPVGRQRAGSTLLNQMINISSTVNRKRGGTLNNSLSLENINNPEEQKEDESEKEIENNDLIKLEKNEDEKNLEQARHNIEIEYEVNDVILEEEEESDEEDKTPKVQK